MVGLLQLYIHILLLLLLLLLLYILFHYPTQINTKIAKGSIPSL